MSEPFLADIKIVAFNFAPRGFATCDGQILPISQNQSLFSLIGNTYGGDGRTSFALPDLRGRAPRHFGSLGGGTTTLGERSGEEGHALTEEEIPNHVHAVQGTSTTQDDTNPELNVHAKTAGGRRPVTPYAAGNNLTPMRPTETAGSGQAHNNMQPYLTLNFVIALQGIFPSRN